MLTLCQRKWLYLQPIFCRGALPQEQGRFKNLDGQFCGILEGIRSDPKVVSLTAVYNIRDTLAAIRDQLERCQKALSDFLEEKRYVHIQGVYIAVCPQMYCCLPSNVRPQLTL